MVAVPTAAVGYCPSPEPSVADEYKDSAAVFVGRVVRIKAAPMLCSDEGRTYVLEVKQVFRGHLGHIVEVSTELNSGQYPADVGETHLLFATRPCGPTLMIFGCGHSSSISKAADTVKSLERLRGNP
jgi:transaldolase